MTIHCFICASPLYPQDPMRDAQLHAKYIKAHLKSIPQSGVHTTMIQNGFHAPVDGVDIIRNPIAKSVAYNWLLCDANCCEDYWLFLPEDCLITKKGWAEIHRHAQEGKPCFALSRDPKALVVKKGLFSTVSDDIQTLCDMNFLGKEIGCVILREELDQRGFHCITKEWKKISANPDRWGNDLYGEMNVSDHPDINAVLKRPLLQDYGFDGWKASKEEIEKTFMKIVSHSLDSQRESARNLKGLISYYGPRISDVPYKSIFSNLINRVLRRKTFKPS